MENGPVIVDEWICKDSPEHQNDRTSDYERKTKKLLSFNHPQPVSRCAPMDPPSFNISNIPSQAQHEFRPSPRIDRRDFLQDISRRFYPFRRKRRTVSSMAAEERC